MVIFFNNGQRRTHIRPVLEKAASEKKRRGSEHASAPLLVDFGFVHFLRIWLEFGGFRTVHCGVFSLGETTQLAMAHTQPGVLEKLPVRKRGEGVSTLHFSSAPRTPPLGDF